MADIFDQLAANGNNPNTPTNPAPSNSGPKQTGTGDIFDQLAASGNNPAALTPQTPSGSQPGQITNDVGNTVIVPKDGESFADTMKRAAAYGKTVTQDQLNKEEATIPKKAATVLAAAPVMGFGGAAGLAGLGELVVNSPAIGKAVINHLMEPGSIFKFPAGRAIEYYLAGKLGLSKAHLSEVAKMVP